MPDPQPESKKKLTWVLSNRLGNVQIQTGRGKKGEYLPNKLLILVAGYNLVPEATWTEAKGQSGVKRMLRCTIRETGSQADGYARVGQKILVEGKTVDATDPLKALSAEDGTQIVENIESLKILKDLWLTEMPQPVKVAISNRVEMIEKEMAKAAKK